MSSLAWRVPLMWLLLSAAPAGALAAVDRYAVIVGNNRGFEHESPLRYAETDARRVYEVLRDLGGFEALNMALLQGEDAQTVRGSLLALNARIRRRVSLPGVQVMLFVYYSGHADATSLHLGDSHLPLRELTQLVEGSSATFRIAVLDACKSGSLTRTKGGDIISPFSLLQDRTLPSEGLAFLTASAEGEDAQESDQLRGSFFTHALVSGLLGAADANGDGRVVLDEAYRYAYESTLRSTSRTQAGIQHPSYRYDLRGKGTLTLTEPGRRDPRRGQLQLPADKAVLLMRSTAQGQVVAEVGARARSRLLSLRPGRYFVRARGRTVLHEGEARVVAGTTTSIALGDLDRIEYARLVRKGGTDKHIVHSLALGASARSALPNAATVCPGALLSYGVDTRRLGMRLTLGLCGATTNNGLVETRTIASDADLYFYHAWDIGRLSLDLGLGGGLSWFQQRLVSTRRAPDRSAVLPFITAGGGTALALPVGYYVGSELRVETHVLRIHRDGQRIDSQVALALRGRLTVGKRF